jgi:hypothetical protein
MNGAPGRFVFAPVDAVGSLPMNLRVFDVTRADENFGTEIPIVRESQFATNVFTLVGVPADPRFRNTLRIYSDMPGEVLVTVGNLPPVRVELEGGFSLGNLDPDDLFTPAYGAFTNFPTSGAPVRVTVEADDPILIISLLPFERKLWGFITVTNNDTQAITTITPHP